MAEVWSVVKRKRPSQSSSDVTGLTHGYPPCLTRNTAAMRLFVKILLILTIAQLPRTVFVRAEANNAVCGCSPPTYTFLLDFTLFCPPIDINRNPGIQSLSCLISPFGAPTTDLVPVLITHVDVLELDQSNNVLVQSRIDGDFLSGETFSYTSILNNTEEIDSTEEIPRALQMNLNAKNEAGVTLINVFVITFSNQCGAVPVFESTSSVQSAGWAVFVSLVRIVEPASRHLYKWRHSAFCSRAPFCCKDMY
jgi:hypothetical protein